MESWDRYTLSVERGKTISCKYVKLAIKRHKRDLRRKDLTFDIKAAKTAIALIESLHLGVSYDDEGKKIIQFFTLTPFQNFIIAMIFGWKLTKNNRRRFRYAYIEMARKNGKSALAAAIGLIMLISEPNAEIYAIATKRDQARIVFDKAKQITMQTPWLRDLLTVHKHVLNIEESFGKFEPLSSDSKKQDGLGPSCTIVDELHEHPNDLMYNVMKSGSGHRLQPLQFAITTAGFDKLSFCYDHRNTCIQILEGSIEDDSMFPMIFTLDEKDNWQNQSKWIKANPNLNITLQEDFLIQEYNQAVNQPSQIVNFKTKNLNIWTQASSVWIKDEDWLACPDTIDKEALKGTLCYGGLDLSKSIDLTSLCIIFPDLEQSREKMAFKAIWRYWLPEASIFHNRDNMNYTKWVDDGYIIATPGREIDYEYIIRDIAHFYEVYEVGDMAYDPYMANNSIVQGLNNNFNIELTTMPQGFKYLSTPTSYIENLVVGKRLNHGSNPVSRWCCSNVELQSNPEGLIKMSKSKSKNKIDGMYSLANALALWLNTEEQDYMNVEYI